MTDRKINFFITLALSGILGMLFHRRRWPFTVSGIVLVLLSFVGYGLFVFYNGEPQDLSFGAGLVHDPNVGSVFLLGLIGGVLTFGGAYTTIPLMEASAVAGGWMTTQQFLDSVAITNILPTPLVRLFVSLFFSQFLTH